MVAIETLQAHQSTLEDDLAVLGLSWPETAAPPPDDSRSIWSVMRDRVVTTADAAPPDDTARTRVQTAFATSLVDTLRAIPEGSFEPAVEACGLYICKQAEPRFQATVDYDYVSLEEERPLPSLFIEHDRVIVGVAKPYQEPSVLGLETAPGLSPGVISGFPNISLSRLMLATIADASSEIGHAPVEPRLEAVVISLESLRPLVGEPLRLRGSTFGLDEAIRRDFSRPGRPIIGTADMRAKAERLIGQQERRATQVGQRALEMLASSLR